jgi:hypothetical protein
MSGLRAFWILSLVWILSLLNTSMFNSGVLGEMEKRLQRGDHPQVAVDDNQGL